MNNHSMDLFLEACSATRPLYLDIEFQGRQEPTQRILYQPFALIGRESRSDLHLNHPQVSKRHAYLQLIGGRVFCIDLLSRTGTHWEWGPKRSGWLDYQQAVRIGPCWIRVTEGEQNGQRAAGPCLRSAAEPWAEQELPEVTLEFVNRAGKSTTWQMAPALALVGNAPECRVHLVGRSVSRFHCSLVRTPLGVWVIDLLGRGGVAVNGLPVRCTRLDDGDRLRVGKFLIHLHYDTEPVARPERATEPPASARMPSVNDISVLSTPAFQPQPEEDETHVLASSFPAPAGQLPPESGQLLGMMRSFAAKTWPAAQAESSSAPLPSPGGNLVLAPLQPSVSQSELTQAIMIPVARQLGLMQQQMFDQFQQAMMMMFQMFNTLQRDQVGLISEELQHLRELSEEVHALQVELAKRTAPVQPPPPIPVAPSRASLQPEPSVEAPPLPIAASPASAQPEPPVEVSTPPAIPFQSFVRPAPPVEAPATAVTPSEPASQPQPAVQGPGKPYERPRQRRETAPAAAAKMPAERPPEPGSSSSGTEPDLGAKRVVIPQGKTDVEIQAWLNQRIMAIQHERQTRWQKIVNFMTGKEPTL